MPGVARFSFEQDDTFGMVNVLHGSLLLFNPQHAQDLAIMSTKTPLWRPQRPGIFSSSSRISLPGKRKEMDEFQLMPFTGLLPPCRVFPHFAGWVGKFGRGKTLSKDRTCTHFCLCCQSLEALRAPLWVFLILIIPCTSWE